MIDFAELKFIRSNVTTIRLMNPTSVEVQTAVHDWRQGELRINGDYGIYVDKIKVNLLSYLSKKINYENYSSFRRKQLLFTMQCTCLHQFYVNSMRYEI